MKIVKSSLVVAAAVLCCIVYLSNAVSAQDTILVGTKITVRNWQNYKQFMTESVQALFSGKYLFKVPPDAVVEVGPMRPYNLPSVYWNDTEKYSSQVKLRELPGGGYTLDGYVAGAPFPHPSGPLAGEQLLYDLYYAYRSAYQYERTSDQTTDAYLNRSSSYSNTFFYRLSHVTDAGYPIKISPDLFQTLYTEIYEPEQAKYTTELELSYDDPQRLPEVYVFVPSLRRSLRLSAGARCAPAQGTDFTTDDETNTPEPPGIFQARLLGEKNVLAIWPDPNTDSKILTSDSSYYLPAYFPRPIIGGWQMRPAWIVELRRLPSQQAGYCYGKRIVYIDKATFASLNRAMWDAQDRLWKADFSVLAPVPVPGGGYEPEQHGMSSFDDLQNSHQTMVFVYQVWLNRDVPANLTDLHRYASPGGLAQILQ
jgi:hypothetical protein